MATIQYSDVIERQLLPVDAQNIVTRVRLVVAGDMAGHTPWQSLFRDGPVPDGEQLQYIPAPMVHVYEAAEHATYGAERSFALPAGVNPFLPPTDLVVPEPATVGMANPGVPSAVRDGDPTTYAENLAGGGCQVNYGLAGALARITAGYRLVYSFQSDPYPGHIQPAWVDFIRNYVRDGPSQSCPQRYLLDFTRDPDDVRDLYGVAPSDARATIDNEATAQHAMLALQLHFQHNTNVAVRVHHFYPLILNEPLLEDIARAQIRLPALLPQRVTVRGYVSPDREHTITGWPGGDYTGVVAQHQYELGRTVIDFEQAGSPVGLPAEAMEAARERKQAIDGTVQTANYNLMMGSRR